MSNSPHQYVSKPAAEEDLKIFSSMNANEDKPLYLLCDAKGIYTISSIVESGGNPDSALMIGFNGVLFTR